MDHRLPRALQFHRFGGLYTGDTTCSIKLNRVRFVPHDGQQYGETDPSIPSAPPLKC